MSRRNSKKNTNIPDIILEYCTNHGSYVSLSSLRYLWYKRNNADAVAFSRLIDALTEEDTIRTEGLRVYLTQEWKQEEYAAEALYELLSAPPLPSAALPEVLHTDDLILTSEQRDAVETALNSRLSLILAGAGCGKTTIVQALVKYAGTDRHLICSPTAKAATNLTQRTGLSASTVHRALGIRTRQDFLTVKRRSDIDLIIVDEAAMLSLDMLAGILRIAPEDSRIVLLGDPGQIPPVGSGDVINDLRRLGFPRASLHQPHRQKPGSQALFRNITEFENIYDLGAFSQDDSFRIFPCADRDCTMEVLARHAADRILAGEDVQVIAGQNEDVEELNRRIQRLVNPSGDAKGVWRTSDYTLMDGDRVVIKQNNYYLGCFNGETGIIRLSGDCVAVELGGGRVIRWQAGCAPEETPVLLPAYAITAHCAQGSEYDDVLVYVHASHPMLLHRNWLYTAMSRAKQHLTLYGDPAMLARALRTPPPDRKSYLVIKTRRLQYKSAD